jgi:hypothetical protein
MISHGRKQRPGLITIERDALRFADPDRLHGPHRVPDESTHLHGLIDHLGEHLPVVAHRTRSQRLAQPRLPLSDDPVVEVGHLDVAQPVLDLAHPILGLSPRRAAHRVSVDVVQPPVGQAAHRAQCAQGLPCLGPTLGSAVDRLLLCLGRGFARPLLPRHPPGRTPPPIGLAVDGTLAVARLAEHPQAFGRGDALALTSNRHRPTPTSCRKT